jgi:hypothetical protein
LPDHELHLIHSSHTRLRHVDSGRADPHHIDSGRAHPTTPNPSASIHAWPLQHPILASLIWSIALVAIFAPLATALYRRRTTD